MSNKLNSIPFDTQGVEMVPWSLYKLADEDAKGWHEMYIDMCHEKQKWFNECCKLMDIECELKCQIISMEDEIADLKRNVHTCKIVSMNFAK